MTGKGVQKEFKRYTYTISDRASNLTLIHYKGDDSIVNENPHVRTCSSVLRELENATQSPSVVYNHKIADCSSAMLIVQYCYLETESKCQILNISGDKHFVCLMMPFEAIDFHLPNICRFLCSNHAIKFWLRKHGATASEVPVYVSDIRDFFHQENNYVWGTQAEILICTFFLGPSL